MPRGSPPPPKFGVRARCSSPRLGFSADAQGFVVPLPMALRGVSPALQVSIFGWDLGHCRPLEPHNALQVPPENKDLQQKDKDLNRGRAHSATCQEFFAPLPMALRGVPPALRGVAGRATSVAVMPMALPVVPPVL